MESDFKQACDKLFPMLDDKGKSILRKMALIHDEGEKEFYEDIEAYEAEVDQHFEQIEKLTDETEKHEDLKIKLKNKVNKIRKINRERRKLASEIRGVEVSKGRLKSKYSKAVNAMEDIYDICEAKRFTNIDNLKMRMKRITGAFVHCDKCKQPLNDCQCD